MMDQYDQLFMDKHGCVFRIYLTVPCTHNGYKKDLEHTFVEIGHGERGV